jgi:hypothetical protein
MLVFPRVSLVHSGHSFQSIPAYLSHHSVANRNPGVFPNPFQLLYLTIPAKAGIQAWGGDYSTSK